MRSRTTLPAGTTARPGLTVGARTAVALRALSLPVAQQPLGGQRGLDRWAVRDPLLVILEDRPQRDVDTDLVAPPQHHEQIGVGDHEGLAHQERAIPEHLSLIHISEPTRRTPISY